MAFGFDWCQIPQELLLYRYTVTYNMNSQEGGKNMLNVNCWK